MPLPTNIKAIETVTVGSGGQASIQFNNIPQTYTDLYILVSGRGTNAGSFTNVQISFNGSSSNYTLVWLGDAVGSVIGATQAGFGANHVFYMPGGNAGANYFANSSIYISNYTSSENKIIRTDGGNENNAATLYNGISTGMLASSAAITSIALSSGGSSWAEHSTATLYGVTSAMYNAKATGGVISQDSTYYYHTFLSSGTFTPTQSLAADILVVAGGGGGGSPWGGAGGGGGAGGILLHSSQSLTSTGYTVTVGGGGTVNAQGGLSQFGSLTSSTGGGRGGLGSTNGGNGGSGGGCASAGSPGTGTSGQGNNGGTGLPGSEGGGGGGGAGAVGGSATGGFNASGGAGGIGITTYSSWGAGENFNGTYYLAGGGGGGAYTGYNTGIYAGIGGRGGGGAGGGNGTNRDQVAVAGSSNTGGGGGGCGYYSAGLAGASGGSGVVVIRYAK